MLLLVTVGFAFVCAPTVPVYRAACRLLLCLNGLLAPVVHGSSLALQEYLGHMKSCDKMSDSFFALIG